MSDSCVTLLNVGARQVFERWMEWEPEEQAWHSYINFELRYKELNRARVIYEKYILLVNIFICTCAFLILIANDIAVSVFLLY